MKDEKLETSLIFFKQSFLFKPVLKLKKKIITWKFSNKIKIFSETESA